MKKFVFLAALATLALVFAFRPGTFTRNNKPSPDPYAGRETVECAPPDKNATPFRLAERMFIPLPGTGNHTWKVNTSVDSAQFYFNQGLNLFYSFHLGESKLSFQEAQRQDSNCAMAYWGYAMGNGPIINNTNYPFNDAATIEGLEKGYALATEPLEKELIKAQQQRYVKRSDVTRRELNIAYREAMKKLYEKYPGNIEVATLYVDAAMIVDARNWYDIKGKPYEGTDDLIALLEKIIEKNPNHPAALHYYIHMVEYSHTPERARDESDRLMYLLPSVTHMVHMPSHIYIRTGDYQKGILSNELAVKGYDQYRDILKNGWEGSRHLYLYHNVDMQGSNALMMANYAEAKKAFDINAKRFKPSDTTSFAEAGFGHYVQFLTAQPYLVNVRFGKWSDILQTKKPVSNYIAHKLYWHFGQGMAQAKTKKMRAAKKSLQAMKELMKDQSLSAPFGFRSPAKDVMPVPAGILEGTIALAENRKADAIKIFTAAVAAEDTIRYAEPESWRLPARHYLGHAYLMNREFEKAQQVFEEDLVEHPNNYWAIKGLYQSLVGQNKLGAVNTAQAKYNQFITLADIDLNDSVY